MSSFLIKIKAYSKLYTWNMVMSIIRYMAIYKGNYVFKKIQYFD